MTIGIPRNRGGIGFVLFSGGLVWRAVGEAKSPLRRVAGTIFVLVACLSLGSPARAQLQSGAYQMLPGMSVHETGDRVTNGSRVVPISGTLIFDLAAAQPSLTAIISNAVLEGGPPFPLTVQSSSGAKLADGSYHFTGDYLHDLYPSGLEYLFDWKFSETNNGEVVWNGITGCACGHIWYVGITNLTIVPVPWLNIVRMRNTTVQVAWSTNFAGHVLEYSPALPALSWNIVTNTTTITGDRIAVTLDAGISNRFYRLRKP
jgi:hypothetical protein